jgi:hypothetical protein
VSKWRDAYFEYENLQARWSGDLALLKYLVYSAEPEYWLQRYVLQLPSASLLAQARRIAPTFRDAMSLIPRWAEEPLEDVYHAAIYLESAPEYWSYPQYTYRGQRKREWPLLPALFRAPNGRGSLTSEEYNLRLNRVAAFSEAIEAQYPGKFNEDQCIAIGQHYGVESWLLDLTSDPWVALFFGSDHGETGDIGVLIRFSEVEWNRMSAGGENTLGAMALIKAPGVPRIEAQKALFLNGSHPDLIDQYAAQRIQFFQKEGLVFESSYKGVTREKLLSDDEFFATFTNAWLAVEPRRPSRPLGVRPRESATRPLRSMDYREILDALIEGAQQRHLVSEEVDKRLNSLCDFHLKLQAPAYAAQYGSIHLLIGAAERTLANQDFDTILDDLYRNHVKPEVLEQALISLREGKSAIR